MGEMERSGLIILAASPRYITPPIGSVRQPAFLNMVLRMRGSIGPSALLRLLKTLERKAGRRERGHWQPRPLDLDIIDHGGRRIGPVSRRRARSQLRLPHPEMHNRGFVLVPLSRIAPGWRHPVLGASARQLLARCAHLARGIRENR